MKIFYALVHKEPGSAFGVIFPDLPGCFAAADAETDLLEAAQEALGLFAQDAEALALPRTLADLQKDKQIAGELRSGAVLLAVPLIEMGRKARYNVMLDADVVAGVDRKARAMGISRSEFLSGAARERLASVGAGAASGRTRISTPKKATAKKK